MVNWVPPIDTLQGREALARSNRRVLAERLGWPAGHLEACEQVDVDRPGWFASWYKANLAPPEFAHPARFSGWRRLGNVRVHAETIEGLLTVIDEAEVRIAEEAAREAAGW